MLEIGVENLEIMCRCIVDIVYCFSIWFLTYFTFHVLLIYELQGLDPSLSLSLSEKERERVCRQLSLDLSAATQFHSLLADTKDGLHGIEAPTFIVSHCRDKLLGLQTHYSQRLKNKVPKKSSHLLTFLYNKVWTFGQSSNTCWSITLLLVT